MDVYLELELAEILVDLPAHLGCVDLQPNLPLPRRLVGVRVGVRVRVGFRIRVRVRVRIRVRISASSSSRWTSTSTTQP